ncbi:MAG TPA: carboxy terminal-processing peptidase [Chitinophagaceae bacterium]|nr:carboxy terminal-processing peptidase [Chitinophagaceae bacterium]
MKWTPVAATAALLLYAGCLLAQTTVSSKAILVKRKIELSHFSPRPVDDSFSLAMFRSIMKTIDRRQVLFTAAEYKSLSAYSTQLDDELNGKSWNFFPLFEQLYRKAITRADSIITKITAKPFDFTTNETITFLRQGTVDYPADVNGLVAKWQKRLKYTALDQLYDIVLADSTGKTTLKTVAASSEAKIRERVRNVELRSLKKKSADPAEFTSHINETFLNAVATGFDPHTNYFSPDSRNEFQEALSTEELSFGLDLDENDKGQIVIGRLTPGGPAWRSGDLNKGDEVISLQWEGKEAVEITGLTLEEAYDILEQKGSDRIVVKVQKSDGTVKIALLRKEKISNEENIVKGFVLKGEKKIGYILLPGFYTEWENESGSSCANDVAKEIVKLKRENIEGLILDVRFNGGGSMGEAMELTGIFIDEGPLVGTKQKDGKLAFLKDPNRGQIYTGPMVLMVNGQSASASEMLAAALQDYNRAVIVGSNTFGKATMQQMMPLDTVQRNPLRADYKGDIVKVTMGKLYRLSGETAQLNGVKPDVSLPDPYDAIEYREKFLPFALPADPVAKNNYYKPLPALPVAALAAKSNERVNNSKQFQEIRRVIESIRARISKTETVSLKLEGYEQWAKAQSAEMGVIEGETDAPTSKYTVDNHALDKQLIGNSEYAKEINQVWLHNIVGNIYIEEAFMVLCDLIKQSPLKAY